MNKSLANLIMAIIALFGAIAFLVAVLFFTGMVKVNKVTERHLFGPTEERIEIEFRDIEIKPVEVKPIEIRFVE